jgi:pimeloyl-ACP methyl ester carboxylesterase
MTLKSLGLAAALSCLLMAAPALSASPPGIPDGWSDAYVYSNGARLHYYHAVPNPGKPVMVMAHGMSDNGLTWTTLTWDLQKNYDIYMLDARGHGLSDPFPDAPQGGDTHVEDIAGFIKAMNFQKPILMGHSMGAGAAMRLGATYPDLVSAIILLDPNIGTGLSSGPTTPVAAPAAAPAPAPVPATAATRRPGSMSMSGAPELMVAQNNDTIDNFAAACARSNPMWDTVDCQYWALSKKQFHGAYTPAQTRAMAGVLSPADALPKITAPILILKADAPPEARAADLQAAKALKNGKLVHLDGARHNLHHDKRAQTVQLITEFLNGVK